MRTEPAAALPPPFDCFTALRDRDLAREGIVIAEGHLVARRLLESRLEMIAALVCPSDEAEWRPLVEARGAPLLVVPEAEIARVAGYDFHRGVMAAARVPILPGFAVWWQALAMDDHPQRVLVLPELNDAENLGAICRSAAALGWDAFGVGPRCVSPWSRRSLRVSMGNSLRLPAFGLAEDDDFAELKRQGFVVVGTSLNPKAISLTELKSELKALADLAPPGEGPRLALVFGNEFTGLTPRQEAACHRLVRIPMHRGTDSLNVSVAAGIFLHALGPDA